MKRRSKSARAKHRKSVVARKIRKMAHHLQALSKHISRL